MTLFMVSGMPLGIELQHDGIILRRRVASVKNKPQRSGDTEKKGTQMNTDQSVLSVSPSTGKGALDIGLQKK